MSKLLDDLLQSAGAGPEQLAAKVQSLGRGLTPALAKEANDAYKRAISNQQAGTALGGAMIASVLYLKLGMMKEGLAAHFDWFQILFMQANSVKDYQAVHQGARNVVPKAQQIGDRDLAFLAHELAADAAYFASEAAASDPVQKEKWLEIALQDLLSAFAALPGGRVAGNSGIKLVSTLAAVAEELGLSGLGKKPKLTAALRQLAAKADASVPSGFAFPGDPKRTQWIRRILAGLPR